MKAGPLPPATRPTDMRYIRVNTQFPILAVIKELVRLLPPYGILVGWKIEPMLVALGLILPEGRVIDMAYSQILIHVLIDQ